MDNHQRAYRSYCNVVDQQTNNSFQYPKTYLTVFGVLGAFSMWAGWLAIKNLTMGAYMYPMATFLCIAGGALMFPTSKTIDKAVHIRTAIGFLMFVGANIVKF